MSHRIRRKSHRISASSRKDHFESSIKLPIRKIDLSVSKEQRLIDSLDSSLKELAIFTSEIYKICREVEEITEQKIKIGLTVHRLRDELKKYDNYRNAGILGRLLKSKPIFGDGHYKTIRKELQQKELESKKLADKRQQLNCDLNNRKITIEEDVITNGNYRKKESSINLRKRNAESRLSELLRAKSHAQSKEESIQEREKAAASEVGKYKAYAAAYFGESRKLATIVKNEMLGQEKFVTGCPYCGSLLDEIPHADHIYPITKGGLSVKENMVYVCSKCNLRKSGMTLREFIEKAGLKRTFVETNLKKLGKTF